MKESPQTERYSELKVKCIGLHNAHSLKLNIDFLNLSVSTFQRGTITIYYGSGQIKFPWQSDFTAEINGKVTATPAKIRRLIIP